MMRFLAGLRAAAMAAALLGLSTGFALAQAGPAASGVFQQKPDELFPLLQLAQVQKELGLTSGQIERLRGAQDKIEELEEPKDENGDTRELTEEEVPRVAAKQNEVRSKAMAEILSARQQTRLQQILAQIQGPSALLKKPVLAALGVTDEQQNAMLDARKATVAEISGLREQASDKNASRAQRERAMDKLAAARDAMVDRMLAALTPEQQKKWRELVGEKFVLKIPRQPLDAPGPPAGPARP